MWRHNTDDRATLIGSIAGDVFLVEPAGEEAIRIPRVVREEPLQVFRRDVAGDVPRPRVEPVRT